MGGGREVTARLAAGLVAAVVLAGCAARAPEGPSEPSADATPRVRRLYANLRELVHEVSHEPSSARRRRLADEALDLGHRCERWGTANALCDYGIALALGVKVRETPSLATLQLPLIVKRLERAAAADPTLDHGGPERVLAILLVRAPGWPAGPGDPETGLETARRAVERAPDYAPNWLAVAEAADATGDDAARQQAAQRAADAAAAALGRGEEDAAEWQREAAALLAK